MEVRLQIGDIVHHHKFGEGTVTAVDKDFCTVAFKSREAMFRLPDAFENGFLKSDKVALDEETVPVQEEAYKKVKGKSKAPTVACVVMALIMGVIFIPIAILFFESGVDFFIVIGVLFCFAPVVGFFAGYAIGPTSSHSALSSSSGSESSSYTPPTRKQSKSAFESDEEKVRKDIYARQDEDLSVFEDMVQMHSVNPNADLEEHYGWDYKIDYDQDAKDF